MPIERQFVPIPKKRLKSDLTKKHQKIGELLGLETVPVHTLAWKESRLDLDSGDCYPVVDVLERLSELFHVKQKKPGRPRKV